MRRFMNNNDSSSNNNNHHHHQHPPPLFGFPCPVFTHSPGPLTRQPSPPDHLRMSWRIFAPSLENNITRLRTPEQWIIWGSLSHWTYFGTYLNYGKNGTGETQETHKLNPLALTKSFIHSFTWIPSPFRNTRCEFAHFVRPGILNFCGYRLAQTRVDTAASGLMSFLNWTQ